MSASSVTTAQDSSPHFLRVPNILKNIKNAKVNNIKKLNSHMPYKWCQESYGEQPWLRWCVLWFYQIEINSFLYWSVWEVTTLVEMAASCQKMAGAPHNQLEIWIFQCLACFSSWERKFPGKKLSVMVCFWGKPKYFFKRNAMLPSHSLKHSVHCAKQLIDIYSSLSMWSQ